jgi:hypothetical protein
VMKLRKGLRKINLRKMMMMMMMKRKRKRM